MSTKNKIQSTAAKRSAKKSAKTKKKATKVAKGVAAKTVKKKTTKAVKNRPAKTIMNKGAKSTKKKVAQAAKKKNVNSTKKTAPKPTKKTAKAVKKTAAKKTTKAVKKTAPHKSATKKTPAKRTTAKATQKTRAQPTKKPMAITTKAKTTKAPPKAVSKAAPNKSAQGKASKNTTPPASTKKVSKEKLKSTPAKKKALGVRKKTTAVSPQQQEVEEKTKAIVLNARKRTVTPAMFKSRKNKHTPVVFTMDDVKSIIHQREQSADGAEVKTKKASKSKGGAAKSAAAAKKKIIEQDLPVKPRNHSAASITDILGFNPAEKANPLNQEDKVPKKHLKYYRALLELRNHVSSELDLHTADTLKRSNKEDSGDLSGYGQHMADAGTDTFDRDFALSLVSSEQEALYEIEEAIQRIFSGNYGMCEITNEPIKQERLEAVPFTRYSLEGQKELERNNRGKMKRKVGGGGVFSDNNDETVNFGAELEDN